MTAGEINLDSQASRRLLPYPRRFSWRTLITVAVVMFAIGVSGTLIVTHRLDKDRGRLLHYSTYQPRTLEEEAFFRTVRPASFDEVIALSQVVHQEAVQHPGVQGSVQLYVATEDLRLPSEPLGERVIIGLPKGLKWIGGQLLNMTVVVANPKLATPELALREGAVLYDSYCFPTYTTFVEESACTDTGRQAVSQEVMYRNLRSLDINSPNSPEVLRVVPHYYTGPVYYASESVWLAPYLGEFNEAPIVILAKGAKIAGGRLGSIQVFSEENITSAPGPQFQHAWFYDPVYAQKVFAVGEPWLCASLAAVVREQYPGACG